MIQEQRYVWKNYKLSGKIIETFLSNFQELKSKMRIPLPTDVILLQCENCQTNLPLNKGGLLTVGEQLQQDIDKVIEEMQKSLIDVHIKQSEECARSKQILFSP